MYFINPDLQCRCKCISPRRIQIVLPLAYSANEMSLRCVDSQLHQTAAKAAGIHPKGPFKIKDQVSLIIEALQSTGPSRTAALETHT